MYQSEANIFCATLHSPNKEGEMRVINALWIYFLSKAVEFFDTFFMVIRKKFNQITFLHCYHHSTMVSEIYFYLKNLMNFLLVINLVELHDVVAVWSILFWYVYIVNFKCRLRLYTYFYF